MNQTVHLCGPHTSVPVKGAECREAIWSEGRACRKCEHEGCHRRGMTKAQATRDNARIVSPPFTCPCCWRQSRTMERRSGKDYTGHTCGCRMMLLGVGAPGILWRRTKQKALEA